MKSVGWCLDRIQIVMADIPAEVISKEDKEKAKKILDEVQDYANTLAQLIMNPNFKNNLHKLEKSSIEEVRLHAYRIEELFKDLEHMLYVVDLYIKSLNDVIINDPEHWGKKAAKLVLMIDQKFGSENGELRKEFQVAIHTQEELKDIVTSEEHLAELLKF